MKKSKPVRKFFFNNLSNLEMIDLINKEFPISLEKNEDIINKIYLRYPLINKTQISIIVKSIFQSIRELLIMGKILNFNNLFFDTKLLFFLHQRGSDIFPAVKVCISTPPPLKK